MNQGGPIKEVMGGVAGRSNHADFIYQHPNVVAIFDAGVDGGDRFIVMELVDGPTLRDVLKRETRLKFRRASVIASQITDALDYAHARDIVHRDVKPSNVLIASNDRVKLADLGIAKLVSGQVLTLTTGIIGTAHYIAPEQAGEGPVDGRADLYSLGCVLFEVLVGRPPFEGDTPGLLYAHVHRSPPRVRSLEPTIPKDLDDLVAGLLEKSPSARPQATEVRAVLDQMGMEEGQESTATDLPTTRVATTTGPAARGSWPSTLPVTDSARARGVWNWHWPPVPAGAKRIPLAGLAGLVLVVVLSLVLSWDQAGQRANLRTREPVQRPEASNETELAQQGSIREASQHVLGVLNVGIARHEVTGGIFREVQRKIDEILREFHNDQDARKALEKVTELRAKVTEAVEKGEITSSARAAAIDNALARLSAALRKE